MTSKYSMSLFQRAGACCVCFLASICGFTIYSGTMLLQQVNSQTSWLWANHPFFGTTVVLVRLEESVYTERRSELVGSELVSMTENGYFRWCIGVPVLVRVAFRYDRGFVLTESLPPFSLLGWNVKSDVTRSVDITMCGKIMISALMVSALCFCCGRSMRIAVVVRKKTCSHCKYDVSESPSNVCSECGHLVKTRPSQSLG